MSITSIGDYGNSRYRLQDYLDILAFYNDFCLNKISVFPHFQWPQHNVSRGMNPYMAMLSELPSGEWQTTQSRDLSAVQIIPTDIGYN